MTVRTFLLTAGLAVALSLAALGIGAAVETPPTLMSRDVYRAALSGIEADARRALARCREASGAGREVCRAEARAAERVAKAQLHARYHGTVSAADEARAARVRADYEVARARCVLRGAHERPACLRAAREEQGRALAESRLAAT